MAYVPVCFNPLKSLFSCLYFDLSDSLGRDTANNGIWLYILRYHCTGCYNGPIAYRHASQHCCVGTDPYVLADVDWGISHALTVGWIEVVVDGGQHYVVTY